MSDPIKLRQALSKQDMQTIADFGREVERLWITPVAGQGTKRTLLTVQNHFDESAIDPVRGPRRVGRTVTSPSDDALAALMMRSRILMLAQEPTYFLRVRKLVANALSKAGDTAHRDRIKSFKAAWASRTAGPLGCPVSDQELLDCWFNAEHFHRDAEKRAELDALRATVGESTLRIWLLLSFAAAQAVLIEFHMLLRDETDLYEGLPIGREQNSGA